MGSEAALSSSDGRGLSLKADGASRGELPPISKRLWRGFSFYGNWYVRRHFHGVWMAKGGEPKAPPDVPVLIYLNHPSWWDPMVCILLANQYFGERKHYAPIDAAMLERYRFFGKLGFFGIVPDSVHGGRVFLRTGRAIMQQQDSALWITAEGHFRDVRQRPVELRSGVAHLLTRLNHGVVLPLAVEYGFWTERLPEVLLRFGEPIDIAAQPQRGADVWQGVLEQQLESTMDALAEDSRSREVERFERIAEGGAGVSLVYDLWRRLWARLTGSRFHREHGGA